MVTVFSCFFLCVVQSRRLMERLGLALGNRPAGRLTNDCLRLYIKGSKRPVRHKGCFFCFLQDRQPLCFSAQPTGHPNYQAKDTPSAIGRQNDQKTTEKAIIKVGIRMQIADRMKYFSLLPFVFTDVKISINSEDLCHGGISTFSTGIPMLILENSNILMFFCWK